MLVGVVRVHAVTVCIACVVYYGLSDSPWRRATTVRPLLLAIDVTVEASFVKWCYAHYISAAETESPYHVVLKTTGLILCKWIA